LLIVSAAPLTAGHPTKVVRPASGGGGPGGGGGANAYANLTATDSASFVPSSITAPAGALLVLRITNTGSFAHTFTLSKTANHTFAQNSTPGQLYNFFDANGWYLNVTLPPHQVTFANVSIPMNVGGNSYEFVSVVPYQFQAGMSGRLNVTSGPSGPPVVLAVNALPGAGTFGWDPSILAVNTTSFPVAISVQVTNLGSNTHTWSLSPFPDYNLSTSNYTGFFQQHPPLAQVNLASTPGGTVDANFTVSKAGVYEYICTITGHFANGMSGYLYVGVPPPAVAAPASTAIVQEGVLIMGASLLGIGVALALVASFTGRFPRRPPSEDPHH
jgi:uncharacterized cupredoxin-like copper-binding protein